MDQSQNSQLQKVSIRFFNDKEVRAAWDEAGNRWLFSVVDVVGVLTESKNPRNYWKVLKYRLLKGNSQLVTKCNQLKLLAADGKRYLTDCLLQDLMINLIKEISVSFPWVNPFTDRKNAGIDIWGNSR